MGLISFAQGEDMEQGCTASDYDVNIGLGQCGQLELNTNSLHCKPPEDEPVPPTEDSARDDSTLGVSVSRGDSVAQLDESSVMKYLLEQLDLRPAHAARQIGVGAPTLQLHLEGAYVRSDSLAKYRRWLSQGSLTVLD